MPLLPKNEEAWILYQEIQLLGADLFLALNKITITEDEGELLWEKLLTIKKFYMDMERKETEKLRRAMNRRKVRR